MAELVVRSPKRKKVTKKVRRKCSHRVFPGKKESILRKKLSDEIEHQRTLGDLIDTATLNFTERSKSLYDFYQGHVLENITDRFQLNKRSRIRVSEIREYTKESLEEHKNFNLWNFVVDAEEIRVERNVWIAGVYIDCLIRCYHQIYEIMVFRISKEEFQYFCLVNCYDSVAHADSGNLKGLRSVSPVKASSSVVLFHLADVCSAIAKARDRLPDLFHPGVAYFAQKVNDYSERLDIIIQNLHLVYPTVEVPNPVSDWNVFFTSQKRAAIMIACEIEKHLRKARNATSSNSTNSDKHKISANCQQTLLDLKTSDVSKHNSETLTSCSENTYNDKSVRGNSGDKHWCENQLRPTGKLISSTAGADVSCSELPLNPN